MSTRLDDHPAIALSLRVYRALLGAYPQTFRDDYGVEMTLVFRDRCREAIDGRGVPGLIGFWLLVLIDLIKTSIEEHIHKEGGVMSKSTLMRVAGPFLMLGGAMWTLGVNGVLGNADTQIPGIILFLTYVPLTLGLLGLLLASDRDQGSAAQYLLGLAAVAALAAAVSGILIVAGAEMWVVWQISINIAHLGLLLYGLMAINSNLLPEGNVLPALIGLGLFVAEGIFILNSVGTMGMIGRIVILTMSLGWVLLGLVLLIHRPTTEPAAA